MARLSRRRIAASVAERLLAGKDRTMVLRELAAYLITYRLSAQADLYALEIERQCALRGVTVVDIASAYELSDALRELVRHHVGQPSAQLRETIEPELIGGIIIESQGERADYSVASQLRRLRTIR